MPPESPLPPRRFLLPLLALFAGSGCSALIYEIVWLQLLQLSIGSSAVSLAVLLGTYMGGMCLGSLALPRFVPARRHPLRVYAAIELGIGIFGAAVLYAVPPVVRLYAGGAGSGLPDILLRGLVCAVCLLPPTLLMGASLPAIARWTEATPHGVSWLGFFYGGNIAGAVFGCLFAGFYLLRVYDMATATVAAAAVNVAVAAVAFGLAARAPHHAPAAVPPAPAAAPATGAWTVYTAIGVSGLCALSAEVIWTRLLSLMMGATVYTFSLILAVFLLGLGLGSGVGSWLSRGAVRPRTALACCQILLVAAIAWAAFLLARSLPYWPVDPSPSASPWFQFGLDLLRCACAVLPAACLWGASFPLALAAAARREEDAGQLAGRVYAVNTLGAILGAAGASLVLIPGIGTHHSQQLLSALSAAAALLVSRPRRRIVVAVAAPLAALLIWAQPPVPWEVIAYGRDLGIPNSRRGTLLEVSEGMNASVAVTEYDNTRLFHVSGKVEASSSEQDMRLQRMLGHIPALVHSGPRSVLVVGCGAGVTAGAFVTHPAVARIVICEIEPRIPPAVARHFRRENHGVVDDPRTQLIFDDARHHVFTTRETFDVITSDPIHPWVKGAATLYTKEYFELCRRRLNPGGVITQWVPLYQSTAEAVRSELATFFAVFPEGVIWGNDTILAEGYDIVLMAQVGGSRIDVDALQERLNRPDHAAVARSLRDVGFRTAVGLLATYAGRGADLREWLQFAPINLDRNLRLQYLAGMGINIQRATSLYLEILRYRRYPHGLFVTSDASRENLRRALRLP